eukprot:TRINITY_DN3631_c1_g1_i2.p1 TRINITY_DN3631_c1_g1~~TRINITY_DN3631_c1_g1_i2.p1  ORF type:complete len:158 (-),score=37.24 TRINITY_DN3631_c1_g1_i2:70-543(-)
MRVLQIEKVLVVHKTILPFKKKWNKIDYENELDEIQRDYYNGNEISVQFKCCTGIIVKATIEIDEKLKRHPRQINVTKEVRIGKKLMGWKFCKYLDGTLGTWYKRMIINEKGKWFVMQRGKRIEVPNRFIRLRHKRKEKKKVEEEEKEENKEEEKKS